MYTNKDDLIRARNKAETHVALLRETDRIGTHGLENRLNDALNDLRKAQKALDNFQD